MEPNIGRCGEQTPALPGTTPDPRWSTHCALPHGHAGWHRDDHSAEWANTTPPAATGVDLRHLAVILNEGQKAADRIQDPGLSVALGAMAEVAVHLHVDPNSDTFWNLDREFAELVEKLT